MQSQKSAVLRWVPVAVWMAAIFVASATPSRELPNFGSLDYLVKKTGHTVAYALLALLVRRALGRVNQSTVGSWLVTVVYALLDEFHQSFVPGRHPSLIDAFVFDGGGAAMALLMSSYLRRGQDANATKDSEGS